MISPLIAHRSGLLGQFPAVEFSLDCLLSVDSSACADGDPTSGNAMGAGEDVGIALACDSADLAGNWAMLNLSSEVLFIIVGSESVNSARY